ncbi:hypothetical protein J2W30_006402 [Variovorax boronicumulans]|uniref:hypothetical protein n=1 Tax=Variovorax boronicumulans TaxID=436515 RepID=UPI0027834C29|nr:hypothetical protein [Variovorax boronicumulans]MDP9995260.1 hypothetical protein [Variovorax boronicumulans]MDQ0006550.1 hypothetical protein [Variovorax boronicumulans]MDQ0038615.1 hypothetical protein [Variovorax boronicumulans]MDQ0044304.1 hypothetical protein [Variovorax boronicumulans]
MDSDEEWLHVRMRRGRESTPVKISRKVFEDHFGGQSARQSLTLAYVVNIDAIHEAIRAKLARGGDVTVDHPLESLTSELSSSLQADATDVGSGCCNESRAA